MSTSKVEDIKEIALKLDEIRNYYPEDYFYLKGWIHCLLRKEDRNNKQSYNEQIVGNQRINGKRKGKTSEIINERFVAIK